MRRLRSVRKFVRRVLYFLLVAVVCQFAKRRTQTVTQHLMIPADFLQRLCFAVKAHDRPLCAQQFVESLRSNSEFDSVQVFISDDGNEVLENLFSPELKYNIRFIRNGIDTGTSQGRNELVQAAKDAGYEYLFMVDEDYVFPSPDTFWQLAAQLFHTGADIVALNRCESTKDCSRGVPAELIIDSNTGIWKFVPFDNRTQLEQAICVKSDLIQQIFLARLESLSRSPWDHNLKNNDHYDFLFTAKSRGMKLYSCPALQTLHQPAKCSNRSPSEPYMKVRHDRWRLLLPYVLLKWNISILVDELGRSWS